MYRVESIKSLNLIYLMLMEDITQPLVEPQPIPTPQNKSIISSKLILFSIAGIVLLIIVLGGGYFLGTKRTQPSPQQVVQQVQPTQLAKPTSTPDETANWKIYTNDVYHLSIKYPSDWHEAKGSGAYGNYADGTHVDEPVRLTATNNMFGGPYIGITVYQNKDNLTALEYFKKMADGNSNIRPVKDQPIYLKGQDIVMIDGLPGAGTPGHSLLVNDKKGEMVLLFNNELDRKTVDSIFYTFKFTDQNQMSDTSNWKTYTGQKYTFKFPDNWTNDVSDQKYMESGIILHTVDLAYNGFNDVQKGAFIYRLFMTDNIPLGTSALEETVSKNNTLNKTKTLISKTKIMLQSQQAIKTISTMSNAKSVNVTFIYPDGKNYSWLEMVSSLSEFDKNKEIFDQIMATFKFIK